MNAAHRRDVDDGAGAPRHHPGQHRLRQPERRCAVHLHQTLLPARVGARQRAERAEAGIVHEQVHPRQRRQLGRQRLDRVGLRQVGRARRGVHAVPRGERRGHRPEAGRVARDEQQVVAIGGEPVREGAADARGRTGDHGQRARRMGGGRSVHAGPG
jgi:hypothetical protein